jgi:hypothetical protein
MKNILIMIALLFTYFSFDSLAQETIICDNGSCSPSGGISVLTQTEQINQSQIEIDTSTSPIDVIVPNGESPRNVYLEISDNTDQNLSFDMKSSKEANSGGSFALFAKNLNTLSAILNGKSGNSANDSASKCASDILNNALGSAVRAQFLQARTNDSSLPSDKCVEGDLNLIGVNQFSCPSTFTETTTGLDSTRWTKKRKCIGQAERKMCLERKMKIKCIWLGQTNKPTCGEDRPADTTGVVEWLYDADKCIPNVNSGWYFDAGEKIVSEDFVQSRRLLGVSDAEICSEVTGRHTLLPTHHSGFNLNKRNGSSAEVNSYFIDTDGIRAVKKKQFNWYGYSSNGIYPGFNIVTESEFKLLEVEGYRALRHGYSKYSYHLYNQYSVYPVGSINPHNNGGWKSHRPGRWVDPLLSSPSHNAHFSYTGSGSHHGGSAYATIYCTSSVSAGSVRCVGGLNRYISGISSKINYFRWQMHCPYSSGSSCNPGPYRSTFTHNSYLPEASYMTFETKAKYLAPNGLIVRQYHHKGLGVF